MFAVVANERRYGMEFATLCCTHKSTTTPGLVLMVKVKSGFGWEAKVVSLRISGFAKRSAHRPQAMALVIPLSTKGEKLQLETANFREGLGLSFPPLPNRRVSPSLPHPSVRPPPPSPFPGGQGGGAGSYLELHMRSVLST